MTDGFPRIARALSAAAAKFFSPRLVSARVNAASSDGFTSVGMSVFGTSGRSMIGSPIHGLPFSGSSVASSVCSGEASGGVSSVPDVSSTVVSGSGDCPSAGCGSSLSVPGETSTGSRLSASGRFRHRRGGSCFPPAAGPEVPPASRPISESENRRSRRSGPRRR